MIDARALPQPHKKWVERAIYCKNRIDSDFIPEVITFFPGGTPGASHPHGHETGGPVIRVRCDDPRLLDPTLDYLGRPLPERYRDGFPQFFGAVTLHEFVHLVDEFDPEIKAQFQAIDLDDHVWIPWVLKAYTSLYIPASEAPAHRVRQVRAILG